MATAERVRPAGRLSSRGEFVSPSRIGVEENYLDEEHKNLKVCPVEYSCSAESPSAKYWYCISPDTFSWEDLANNELSKSCVKEEMESRTASNLIEADIQKQSILVHSFPSQFPDIHNASKSAFGSIFVKVPTSGRRDPSFLRKIMGHRFDVCQLEKVSGSGTSASEKEADTGDPAFKNFEKCGAEQNGASTTKSQWEICPITESALFTYRIRDCVHLTKQPSAIEERIANGAVQHLKSAHNWPSGSTWTGHWDELGMAGAGTFVMPHEVVYVGHMVNGMCHDDNATLIYPSGFKALHCNYVQGELLDYQFQFPDLLNHEKENWDYCRYPDRRFWSEIQNGLKAAKVAQKTQQDPPRKIPQDSYDTNDGFYNPKTKMLVNERRDLLRVPVSEEAEWIKKKCRKGFHQYTGFCPEMYENWFCDDIETVKTVAEMQNRYFKGEITDEELQQFYANNKITPDYSSLKNVKILSNLESENSADVCPSPRKLIHRLEKRYEGHRILFEEKTDKSVEDYKNRMKQKKQHVRQTTSKPQTAEKPSTEKLSIKVKFEKSNDSFLTTADFPIVEKDSRSILKGKHAKPGTTSKKELHAVPAYRSYEDLSDPFNTFESDEKKSLASSMKSIIMEVVQKIVLQEREKHRNRLVRVQHLNNIEFGPRDEKEKCVQMLEESYSSMSRTEEYCDSVPHQDCDLKSFAKDKFQMVKYWGNRVFTLGFDEDFYGK